MKKFHYYLCCMLVLFCSCVVGLAGCGGSIYDLRVSLNCSRLTETTQKNVYDLTLTKAVNDDDVSWSATIDATVENLSGNMSNQIGWTWDSRFVDVTLNNDGTRAVIRGVTSTEVPTQVVAYSIENRNAQATINITNIVLPKQIVGSKFADGELGIPIGVPTTLDPKDLFIFDPIDATIPEYEYSINGVIANSTTEFTLDNIADGYAVFMAYPKDRDYYTEEEFSSLSYTIERVRVYNPLNDNNTTLTLSGSGDEVEEITLIKNSTNDNTAVLRVTAPSLFDYTVTSDDNIIYDEINNKNGTLSIKYDSRLKEFTLLGIDSMEDFSRVNINLSVSGIKNSLVLTKSFYVRIVDYPTAIRVNGVAGSTDVELRVFDQYAFGQNGTELKLNVAPESKIYRDINIKLDETSTQDINLINSLLINDQPFTGEYDGITSGDTLYLKNAQGYGSFALLVYATNTVGTPNEVVRRVVISLEQSVTAISVDESIFDEVSGNLVLELDEYNPNITTNFRDVFVNIEPLGKASFDTVTVTSGNENIAKVEVLDYRNCEILIIAQNVGSTTIYFTALSGVTYSMPVQVTVRLKQVTVGLDPNISKIMVGKDLTTQKLVDIGTQGDTAMTLDEAYIAKTGSGNGVYLTNTFYPNSAVAANMIESITFVSSNPTVASMINTNASVYRNVLTTERAGVATFDMVIRYKVLEGGNLVSRVATFNAYFTIHVFDQITSIEVSDTNVELLAGIDNFGSGIFGDGSGGQSVYDSANNSKNLRVSVYPSTSTVLATSAVWTIEGNTSKMKLSNDRGAETTVTAMPLSGFDTRVSVTVIVSVTDLNGTTYTKEIKVVSTKIQPINEVYINNYTSSLKNNSLYFELYKDDGFTLDVSVAPSNATNKKLEYIIFDAELLPTMQDGYDIIRVATGNTTGNKYMYFRILSRDPNVDPVYNSQYNCKTASLVQDDVTGSYTIKPKKSGYAFVFIIPQDAARVRVDTITQLTEQLRNVTDKSTIKQIPITIADGLSVPYQLYTAEDVASIGSSVYGLDKNYYLMNTIDMSAYINRQMVANHAWEWTPIGSVSQPFSGSLTSMVYNGESPTQSIVGWTLSRTLSTIDPNSTKDWRNYGIFGVVTGSISNINIYINNYIVKQSVRQQNVDVSWNNYNYGLLVGKLTQGEVTVGDETVTQYGRVADVLVNCAKLTYEYTHKASELIREVYANFGLVGYLDTECTIKNVNVTLNADIKSDDIIVNYGGIAGRNYGIIDEPTSTEQYVSTVESTAVINVTYDQAKSILSTAGGVVGQNNGGAIYAVNVSGQITTSQNIVVAGGVAGIDSLGTIEYMLSSVKIAATADDSIQGGIVGKGTGTTLMHVYYDIYGSGTQNVGMNVKGYSGGIAGMLEDAHLNWAIVQAYDINTTSYNIVSNGGALGGLVGNAINSNIANSFVDAGLNATAGTLGGIVGKADNASVISNAYVRGKIKYASGVTTGAMVGNASSTAVINAYAELDNDTLGAGNIVAQNVYLIRNIATDNSGAVKILNRAEALAMSTADWLGLGFGSGMWAVDNALVNPTNDGYAYLLCDGKPFVRLVPKAIAIDANNFDTIVDGKVNTILNVGSDTKKLIIAYREGLTFDLSELFTLTSTPEIDPANISINISTNSSSVVQLLSAATFVTAKLRVLGTGTSYIRISSKQNPTNAYDVIQICVIDGFDSFDIFDEEGNSLFEPLDDANDFVLKIKHNASTQAFVTYYMGDEVVNSVSGGLQFITGLKRDAGGNLVTARDAEDNVISNYKISIFDWLEYSYNGMDCLYHFVEHNDKIVLTALGDDRDTQFITILLPYYNVQFYTLDSNKNIVALENAYQFVLGDYTYEHFATKLYYGIEDIYMGVGNGTLVPAGDALESGVTIINDAYTPTMTIDDMLWYQLYGVDDEGNTTLLAYYDPTLAEGDRVLNSNDISLSFGKIEFYETSNAVVIPYKVELSQSMRNSLTTNQRYRVVIGAIDDNGERLADKIVSLDWTFIPQEVNHVVIEHFSDAINSGARLKQAGDTPANTIVAGEYGLLRVTISPMYANFDSVEVTSSLVNGSPMVFDQRVLEEEIDPTTKEVIYYYLTWQQGVGNIPNGLSLDRASRINGDFDGVFYVRTICLSNLPTGTQFTITVTITQDGVSHEFTRTLTVYQTDVLSLEGEHYSEALGSYLVAEGTGYTTSETLVQNRNPLTVNIGSAYYDAELTVDEASRAKGARVVNANGRYYLYTGTVQRNNIISVTLTAKQNIGGFTYRATREITYEVVDFYISTLRDADVMSTTKRFAFIDGKQYDLRLFEGINNENLNTVTAITFDTANIQTRTKVLETINMINGIGAVTYNGWNRRTVEPDGRITFVDLEPGDEWIDNHYKFIISQLNGSNNGFSLVSSGISSGNIMMYELLFYYDVGSFTLTDNVQNATFGLTTENISVEFYQVTSQEHPQPIKTLNQFMTMSPDLDYILLNDLYITDAWTPLNVAVKSFNGNGYAIHFKPTSITPTEDNNYGLFGTVDAGTVIKNVYVVIDSEGLVPNNNEAELTELNFGVIAGVNNGTIYNCQVSGLNNNTAANVIVSTPSSTSARFNVAGLVGQNTGGITNSRVMYLNIRGSGNVSGLTVTNSGTISGCYYSGGTITNLSESSQFYTAGLVVSNAYGAKINTSFVGGTYTTTTDNITTLDTRVSDVRDVTIQSGVSTAGFVYSNYGAISDCYSGVKLFSTSMSGFVFTNYASGTINRCYSTSTAILRIDDNEQTVINSYPFIGASGDNATQNNNYNKINGIVNCYYYDSGFAHKNLEEAKGLTADDFCGANGSNVFNEFIFSRTGEAGAEFTGVWTFVDDSNLYFTADRFASPIILSNGTGDLYTNFGPKLVNASLIATPRMMLYKSEENASGEVVHTYVNKYTSVFTANHAYNPEEGADDYNTDYTYDPIVVSNMTQFNQAFDITNDNLIVRGETGYEVILSDIRIISDLTQSDLDADVTLNSPTARYAGILSGNGFTFNGVSLAVNDSTTEFYGLIGNLCRVDASLNDDINYIGTIRNYTATISNVSCPTVPYVGGLVGVVDSANLYDVAVSGTTGRVIGNNVVGGVAGYVIGTSIINTAVANVGVTANFRASTEVLYNKDLIRAHGLDSALINDVASLGYAGGLFGIVDITQFDMENPSTSDTNEARVYNISTNSSASVVGKVVGGLIGGVGEYSVIYKANKEVSLGSLVKGYVFAGGIAGQNNGYIKYANLTYDTNVQQIVDKANTGAVTEASMTLFDGATSPLGIGGIVGLNIGSTDINWPGGTILLSSSKVAVRDVTAQNAGGIAGVAYGGDIRACLATGSVMGSKTAYVGGILGYVSDFSSDTTTLVGMDNPFGQKVSAGTTIDYVVAQNNYLAQDYNYYYTLDTNAIKGIEGAIGGVVGFVQDSGLIYTTHSVPTSSTDPFAYLTNPTNYFVSQISSQIISITQTRPISNGAYFDLYAEDENGVATINKAIGKYGTDNSINLAMGKPRGYMINNYEEIFAGWDQYSISNENGTPSIIEKDLPDIIEIDSIEDLKIMYWHPEKTYVLIDDIDFEDTTAAPELGKRILAASVAIGSESSPFTGKFYGKKKADGSLPRIKSIYIINAGASSLGFFGAVSNADIHDIVFENIHFSTALNENAKASVGALAGVATNSTIQNVSVLNSDRENSGIYTNANIVGGMFGKIRSINSGATLIKDCYVENNLVLTDNIYYQSAGSGPYEVYAGGFAGVIEGNVTTESCMATGLLTYTYSNTESLTTKEGNPAREITHIVGGFAGQITGTATQNGSVSNTEIALNNVLSNSKVGGFVGVANETNVYKVDAHSKININMNNLTDQKTLYVGGLLGEFVGTGSVSGFVSASDIVLSGTYGVDTLNGAAATKHYIAGIAGYFGGINSQCTNGYSITSIINNTTLTSIDTGVGYILSDGIDYASVMADKYYSLAQNDASNLGKSSDTVLSGGGLDTTGTIFERDNRYQYYKIKSTWANIYGSDLYKNMYIGGTGLYKTSPIMVSDATTFTQTADSSVYRYYLQQRDITIQSKLYDETQIATFYGSYNGGGYAIDLPAHFDINDDNKVATTHAGLFGEVLSGEQNSILVGIVMPNLLVYANLDASVEDFGLLAGKVNTGSIVSKCYTAGDVYLNVTGNTNIGGLVGASGATYLDCATDVNMHIYGTGAPMYSPLYARAIAPIDTYSLSNCYTLGSVRNYANSATVTGLVGDHSASNLYAKGTYTMTEINTVNTVKSAPVAYALNTGAVHNADGIWYDANNLINKTNPYLWNTYDYADIAYDYSFDDFGTGYITKSGYNYGMPILKWLGELESSVMPYTGTGVSSYPYKVNTAVQLAWALQNANYGDCYELTSSIDYSLLRSVSGYAKSNFLGYLNGNYNYINNVTTALIATLGGTVEQLGFDNVNTTGTILADSISGGSATKIYANSAIGQVVGSGNISNSASTGATFGANATNCFASTMTHATYNTLDYQVWAYDGNKYMLRDFLTDAGSHALPYGKFGISTPEADGRRTISVSSDQDFLNAIYFAENFSGNFVLQFTPTYNTLNLNNTTLTLPSSIREIRGLRTVTNGYITNSLFDKIVGNSINIQNCGIYYDTNGAMFGTTSAKYNSIVIEDSVIVATNPGGMLFGNINNAIDITLRDLVVFVKNNAIDMLATEATNGADGYTADISNVEVYGYPFKDVIGTNNATASITVNNITTEDDSRMLDYIIENNNANITLTLSHVALGRTIIKQNSGNVTLSIDNVISDGGSLFDTNTAIMDIELNETKTLTQPVANSNSGTINITGANTTISGDYIVATNNANGILNVTLTNSVIDCILVQENKGEMHVDLTNCTLNADLMNTNSGTLTVELRGTALSHKVATTNTANIEITTDSAINDNVVTVNSGAITINTNGATINSVVVGNNTGSIDWNLTNTVIKNYLVDTQDSAGVMTITLNNTNSITHSLIKNANSNVVITLNNVNSTTDLIDNNKATTTINITGGTIYGAVTNNQTGAELNITLTNTTVTGALVETNGGVLNITTTGGNFGTLVDSNTGTLSIDITNATISSAIINTNRNPAKINLDTVTVNSSLVGTNTANIELKLIDCTVNNPIFTTNATQLTVTANGTNFENNIVTTNTGVVMLNITGGTIGANLVGTNNGTIQSSTIDGATITDDIISTNNSVAGLTIKNATISAYVFNTNTKTASVTTQKCVINKLVGENATGASLTINLDSTSRVMGDLITTNTGTATVNTNGATIAHSVMSTNAGVLNVNLVGGTTSATILGTNNGSATISLNGLAHSGNIALIGSNTATATINITGAYTDDDAIEHFVTTNTGTVTININSATNLTNTSEFAFVGTSSGVINLNVNAATSLESASVAGVMSAYTGTGSEVKVVITLRANLTLTGTTASAICGNGADFDNMTNLTYDKGAFDILVNGTAFDPNPTPPDPDPGEGGEGTGA